MTKRLRRAPRRRRSDGGFSLIELMVALLILAIVMSASLYSIMQSLSISRDSQDRVVASSVVSKQLEALHTDTLSTTGFNAIPVGTQTLTAQTLQGVTYKLTQNTEWITVGSNAAACSATSNSGLALRATVTSTWGVNSVESVSETTLLAPPSGTLSLSDGSLGVEVVNAQGLGYSGATVSLTGSGTGLSSPAAQVTGTDGCVYFPNLISGAYSITVTTAGGIDNYEQATYNSTAASTYYTTQSTWAVSAAQPQEAIVDYDNAGTVTWSFAPAYSADSLTAYPPASGMPIGLDSNSLSWATTTHFIDFPNPPTGSTVSGTVSAYPVSYRTIFAGGCTDADPDGTEPNASTGPTAIYPNGLSTSTYPPATYPNLVSPTSVTSGGSASASVYLYPLALKIYNAAGTTALATAVSTVSSGTTQSPTAAEGQYQGTIASNIACPNPSTYTLNPVAAGISNSSVGLGHYYITVSVTVGTGAPMTGTANIWVMPDGVYSVTASGGVGTPYYLFSGSTLGSVPVDV